MSPSAAGKTESKSVEISTLSGIFCVQALCDDFLLEAFSNNNEDACRSQAVWINISYEHDHYHRYSLIIFVIIIIIIIINSIYFFIILS